MVVVGSGLACSCQLQCLPSFRFSTLFLKADSSLGGTLHWNYHSRASSRFARSCLRLLRRGSAAISGFAADAVVMAVASFISIRMRELPLRVLPAMSAQLANFEPA